MRTGVVVWDVAWLRQAYPVHRHTYDYAGVYYTRGAPKRQVRSVRKSAKVNEW